VSEGLWHLHSRLLPPIHQGGVGIRAQALDADMREQAVLDLSGKHTRGEQMVYGLVILSTKHAVRVLLEVMVHPVLRRPQPPMQGQPEEELHFWRGRCAPNLIGAKHCRPPQEERPIS
jgi:hypothetical protein